VIAVVVLGLLVVVVTLDSWAGDNPR